MPPIPPRRLTVVPLPHNAPEGTVLTRDDDFDDDPRFFIGTDARFPDLLCGECGVVLATGTDVKDLVMQCGGCRAFNQV
jgi:hypothetical protein